MNLRNRFLIIAALVAASVWALWPRTVSVRARNSEGVFVSQKVKRVPLKRGLDLQGGIHLALEVDEARGTVTDKSEALDRVLKVVRNRIDQFGVSEPVVQKVGKERIIVELPGIDDPARAEELVKQSAFLQFQMTDRTRALDKALSRIDAILREKGEKGPGGAAKSDSGSASTAISQLFTPGADTGKAKKDSAAADTGFLAGATTGPFSRLVQTGEMPGEYVVQKTDVETLRRYLSLPEIQGALPPGKVIRFGVEESGTAGQPFQTIYVLDARPIITGEYLIDAKPTTDPIEGNVVQFTLNNEGGRRFKNETSRNIGNNMAIVLDDRVMGQPPVIQSSIGTRGQITLRGRPLQDAQDLALVLRAGALPVPLKVAEVRQIGGSLGQDSIDKGIRAGILGLALVVVIMVGYYRVSGVLAVSALTLYVLFTLAALAGFDAVVTLPGLAGMVLSIGIAVDDNVLIFERIREELAHGKTVRVAIDEGFKHAMSAIVDSNVSTILTALVLYQFGTGPVRGFAVTVIAGIVASMVSAIFVVRTFFLLWLNRSRGAQTLSI
jgi:preprotein translocase subunit SecD